MVLTNSIDFYRGINGWNENLGMAVSGSTFTILGAFASALSLRNAAYISFPSSTVGVTKVFRLTANAAMTTGAASDIAGQRFGLTAGVAWNQDIPFFLYAVLNSTETAVAFMVSRHPCARVSPAAASIGKAGATVNVDDGDFFSINNVTVADYAQQSCVCLGTFRMRFNAANYFTVQALTLGKDGVNVFCENQNFVVDTGLFGAAAGSFFIANGGTAPIWTTQQMTFSIQRSGRLQLNFQFETNSTPGAGAVIAQMILPYSIKNNTFPMIGSCGHVDTGTTTYTSFFTKPPATTQNYTEFYQSLIAGNTLNTTFAANMDFSGVIQYIPLRA
jgi:hypothetical protein